ncbi:MAG TPA: hypothetical protein V6D25_17680 [Leptolyngbyaceae cyanobacterium]
MFSMGLAGVAIFAGYQWYEAQNKAKEASQQSAIALSAMVLVKISLAARNQ